MCHTVKRFARCGHASIYPEYCENATMNPITKRMNMCKNRIQTLSSQGDNLCNKSPDACDLIRCNGNWICCTFDGNRYKHCAGGSCNHIICSDCTPKYQ